MKNILNNETYINNLTKIAKKYKFEELKKTTIMITGGLGLIGSAIVDILYILNKNFNHEIKILVAGRNKELFNEKYKDLDNINFVYYDALEPIQFNIPVDYIISCAGIANPKLYIEKPVETLLTSFDGTKNLLDYCLHNDVKRFLYVSSSEIYGVKETEQPYEEKMYGSINLDNLRSSYAIGKISSEILCKSYASEYLVDSVIVRPGHIFGPTASIKDKKISSDFAFRAAYGEELTLKSAGLQKRSYCYCLDCASAVLFALINGKIGEAYNIGHNEVTSIREMSEYMANAGNVKLNVGVPTEEELKSFNPMDNSSLNNEKIKSLGYEDSFGVREACEYTVKILRECIDN